MPTSAQNKLVSISEAARKLKTTREQIRIALDGVEPSEVSTGKNAKLYDWDLVQVLWEQHQEEPHGLADVEADPIKHRKLKADAELQETKLAQLKGELVDVGEVRSRLVDFFALLHKSLVVEFPRAHATELANKDSRAAIAYLQKELQELLDDVAQSSILVGRSVGNSDTERDTDS